MKQLTANVFVETELRGSNYGFVTTSDGIVLIDTPHKPSDALRLRAEVERRGRLRYILNTEPHGDHWTGNAFFDARSEEHTSELQSLTNLVCRLLLEKKKKGITTHTT